MFKILPKRSGANSLESLSRWFDKFKKEATDTKSVWKELTPDIKNAIDTEFSMANPNGWNSIDTKYKVTKVANGFSPNIGVRTGSLRDAAGDNAIITYKSNGIDWKLNENISSGEFGSLKNISVGDYAKYFAEYREIYVYTLKWLEDVGSKAVKKHIKKAAGIN